MSATILFKTRSVNQQAFNCSAQNNTNNITSLPQAAYQEIFAGMLLQQNNVNFNLHCTLNK